MLAAMPDQPNQPDAIAQLSFEAALKRLEEIVRKLESGEAPLDESIELYAEGDRLKQQCEARLQAAQARIEKIQFGRDGSPSGTAPFDDV
jgi:exodeoxyribonuclease VII small subunit